MSSDHPASRFISESAIEEARAAREEAWARAYASGGAAAPAPDAEEYDPRTLYERLQEQRARKSEAYAESKRFANQIRRLGADETDFLDAVDDLEHRRLLEQSRHESLALSEFKDKVAQRRARPAAAPRRPAPPPQPQPLSQPSGRTPIAAKLGAIVVRPAAAATNPKGPPAGGPDPEPAASEDVAAEEPEPDTSARKRPRKEDAGSPPPNPLGLLASYASDDED
ncbi:hypothetical protein H4R18_001385 [Coemansia javaensis]|uniref:FAM192A/Fyv6 N-terminal domain-containing protein n=1 Tax=Coemansia javaensis TaxID=2761396 RepID=A0A9W8HDX9_9FUNG|nr:hypothetical protein H4R18_001385 [Coemansia javaensis]